MQDISSQDFYRVLNCIEALQNLCTLQELPSKLVNLLSPLVGSEASFCSSFTDCCNTLAVSAPELYAYKPHVNYFQENPLIGRYFQTRDHRAYKISDFLSEQEVYRRESLYRGFLHICGVVDQLAMVIPQQSDIGSTNSSNILPRYYFSPHDMQNTEVKTTLGNLAIGFHRNQRSFNERERSILNLIHPHIVHAYRNAQVYTKLQQQLVQFEQAVNQLDSVILSSHGTIQFISPRASQLLAQYFPDSWFENQLPEALQTWVKAQIRLRRQNPLGEHNQPLQIKEFGKCLKIRLLGSESTGQFILALEEKNYQTFSVESLRLIGLTQREAEVLVWVAQSKTNAEIATTLDISSRTVQTHLDNIFKKLNVQTRAQAVTTALSLLSMLD